MSTKITSVPTGDNKINSRNTIITKDVGNLIHPFIFVNPETGEDYPDGVYPPKYSSNAAKGAGGEKELQEIIDLYPIEFTDPITGIKSFTRKPLDEFDDHHTEKEEKPKYRDYDTIATESVTVSSNVYDTTGNSLIKCSKTDEVMPECTVANPAEIAVHNSRSNIVQLEKDESRKLSAVEIERIFLRRVNVFVVGEDVYSYNGKYYEIISPRNLERLVRQICRAEIDNYGRHAVVSDVCKLIVSNPDIHIKELEYDPHMISFNNVVLNIRTEKTYNHSGVYFTNYLVKGDYRPELYGQCPVFNKYLSDITGGDIGIITRIWEMIGYLLSPDTNAKAIFVLQGCPNSGKSVLSRFLISLFNDEAVASMDVHSLKEKFAPCELVGKVLNISPDLKSDRLDAQSVSKLKQFSGNDMISADVKFGRHVKFYCQARFLLATNHALLISGNDEAFNERIVAIPFRFPISKENADPYLDKKFKSEIDSIIATAMKHYFNLRNNKYRFSGDYILNSASCIVPSIENSADTENALFYFMRENYVQGDYDDIVFVSKIADEYFAQTGNLGIEINQFSKILRGILDVCFDVEYTRKRIKVGDNPLAAIRGIKRRVK